MQQRKIDIEQAEIKTAVVEIKSLMVNARKMTLSVFRQIPEEPLLVFNEQTGVFNLAGVPWGLINYYWGDDKDHSGIHVLWQKGAELKRSILRPTIEHSRGIFNEADDLKQKIHSIQSNLDRVNTVYSNLWGKFRSKGFSFIYCIENLEDVLVRGERPRYSSDHIMNENENTRVEELFAIANDNLQVLKSRNAELNKSLKSAKNEWNNTIQLYINQYKTLAELDQLFISV